MGDTAHELQLNVTEPSYQTRAADLLGLLLHVRWLPTYCEDTADV